MVLGNFLLRFLAFAEKFLEGSHLLLRRKAMTNLENILKSRDITLSTKVHMVKAMVFPIVMYGCKRQSTKELMLSSCGAGEDS